MILFLLFLFNSFLVIKFSSEIQIDNQIATRRMNRTTRIHKHMRRDNTVIFAKILFNGTLEELGLIPRQFILESLSELEEMKLPIDRKLVLWETIKNNRSSQMLNHTEIKQIGILIESMPEIDLFNINVSDWEIIDYLGTYPHLHRRRAGIVGYAIKQRWGDGIMSDLKIITKMRGLICGFSLMDLQGIPNQVFYQLDHRVFKHITACTKRQLQILVYKAKLTLVHGPTQSWKAKTCRNLSRLIKSLSIKDLETIKPVAMAGIDSHIIDEMSLEQLLAFNEDQVNHMNIAALSEYRKITGIIYNNSKNLDFQTLFTLIIYKISLHILQ